MYQLKAIGFEFFALKLMTPSPMKKGHSCATLLLGWSYFSLIGGDGCLVVENKDIKGTDWRGKVRKAPSTALLLQTLYWSDNKNRFGRITRRIINALSKEEKCVLECNAEGIGTHRLCKGSTSYALGQVNGPTPVSVYLRVDQRLGKLNDRNIHFGEVADQVCGRMRAGYRSRAEVRRVATPLST
ncbi:hypothetical protein GQ600_18847 [Phytophthora cactorum]|nr:hypothetical protein GQ600_18847 [Phytophthora cactorum]